MRNFPFIFWAGFTAFFIHILWPVSWDAFGLAPNILLIYILFVGIRFGVNAGQWTGFLAGLALDTCSMGLFGASAVLLTLVGHVSGRMQRLWDEKQPSAQIFLTLMAAYAYKIILVFFETIFQEIAHETYWIDWMIRPLMTAVTAPFLFAIFEFLHRLYWFRKGWSYVDQ